MTYKKNNAEGGTAGAQVTTANSGGTSGDAWEAFGSTNPVYYASTQVASGALAYKYTAGSGQTAFHRWTTLSGEAIETRFWFRVSEIPAQSTEILQLRSAGGRMASVYITNTGKLDFQNAAQVSQRMSTMTVAINTGYYVRSWAKRGTTTSNGSMQIDIYNAAGTLIESSGLLTARNTGTALGTEIRAGKVSASTWTSTDKFWTDEWQATDTNTTAPALAAYPANPPVLNTTTTNNKAIIDARTSTGVGALSYTITPTTNVDEPLDGLFLVPTGVSYTVTVTDAGSGQQTSEVVAVAANTASNTFVRVKQAGGTWT